jgi:hypothetical protein
MCPDCVRGRWPHERYYVGTAPITRIEIDADLLDRLRSAPNALPSDDCRLKWVVVP